MLSLMTYYIKGHTQNTHSSSSGSTSSSDTYMRRKRLRTTVFFFLIMRAKWQGACIIYNYNITNEGSYPEFISLLLLFVPLTLLLQNRVH